MKVWRLAIPFAALILVNSEACFSDELKAGILLKSIDHLHSLTQISKELTQSAENITEMTGRSSCDRAWLAAQNAVHAATGGMNAVDSVVGPLLILAGMKAAEDQKLAENVVGFEINTALPVVENAIAQVNNSAATITSPSVALEVQRARDTLIKARDELKKAQSDL